VRVRRLDRDESVVVRINDRGPFVKSRIIDLSHAAAVRLGMTGVAPVTLEVVKTALDPRLPL
jgi:rare lipoprotein A